MAEDDQPRYRQEVVAPMGEDARARSLRIIGLARAQLRAAREGGADHRGSTVRPAACGAIGEEAVDFAGDNHPDSVDNRTVAP